MSHTTTKVETKEREGNRVQVPRLFLQSPWCSSGDLPSFFNHSNLFKMLLIPKSEWVGTAQISNLPAGDHDSPTVKPVFVCSSFHPGSLNVKHPVTAFSANRQAQNLLTGQCGLFGNLKTNRRFLSAKKPTSIRHVKSYMQTSSANNPFRKSHEEETD
jgi:hypothetical protein